MANSYKQATRDTKYQIGMEVKVDRDRDDDWLYGQIIEQTSAVIIVKIITTISKGFHCSPKSYQLELQKSSDWDIIKIKY